MERLETVVVRSDRTVHSAVLTPAPKGTRERERVMRLTDGTLIDREPQANKYGTWSWPSIKTYLDGKAKVRHLADILRDVAAHLRASVWMPNEEDYALLTLTVTVTYAQAIFDSVPLILLTGPAGSGKSEMGGAMARVCCNAYVCGQSSAASIARLIDESRGFVVLDDLEGIGGRGGQFGEIVQALKLSYDKATAVKLWTDVKSMRTERLDFYGVKMINNTRGANEILGSRMLRIQARRIPEGLREGFGDLLPTDDVRLNALRDELHTWTFENARLIESTYRSRYPKTSDRVDEIAAPLHVMAAITGDPRLSSHLEVALARQGRRVPNVQNPMELLRETLRDIVAQGYDNRQPDPPLARNQKPDWPRSRPTLRRQPRLGEAGVGGKDAPSTWCGRRRYRRAEAHAGARTEPTLLPVRRVLPDRIARRARETWRGNTNRNEAAGRLLPGL